MIGFDNLDSSQLQNFIYSGLILVGLLIGLFSRKDISFGKILKYSVTWLGVIVILILLYSYRYSFADFKSRFLGEINPSIAQINKDGQIIISLSDDGHYYINLKINDATVRFMIDTGASDIAINARDAERIGIKLDQLSYNKRYQTANGISFAASVNLRELKIGDIKFDNVPASVSQSEMGVSLLGMSFLKRFAKYEVYQDKFVLYQSVKK